MAEDFDDEDDLDEEMPELDELAVAGDDSAGPGIDPEVVRRFLSKQRALDIAAAAVRPLLPAQAVEDVAADAVVRAVRARPPRVEVVLPGWLAEIARRVAARWLEKRKRRKKHEGPIPVHKARRDDYTGQKVETHPEPIGNFFDPDGDVEEAELLLEPYLDSIVAPHDRPILDVLRAKATGKKTYPQLAAERNRSIRQLERKIQRFKTKYAPRVHRRRGIFLFFKRAGIGAAIAAALVAVFYFLLFRRAPHLDAVPDPATRPLPSASAPGPAPLIAADTLRDAKDLRDSAFAECRATRWAECVRRLDAAKTLDPAGDTAPEVKAAREQAARGLEEKPGDKPKP